jgi:hypothetical protein
MPMNPKVWERLRKSTSELENKGFIKKVDLTEVYRADDELTIKAVAEAAVPFRDGFVSVRSRPRSDINRQLKNK